MATVEDKACLLASKSAVHLEEVEKNLTTLLDSLPNKFCPLALKLEAFKIAVINAKYEARDVLDNFF